MKISESIYYLNQEFPLSESLWKNFDKPFEIEFFKEKYFVNPKLNEIILKNKSQKVPPTFYPILLQYYKEYPVVSQFNIPGEFVSVEFREDWALFFRGVHSLREDMILESVNSIYKFENVMEKFGGKKLSMAESSYCLEPLKGFFLAYLFWDGDDEFEPTVKILFDKRLAVLFMQDIIWGVIVETNFRIKNHNNYFSIFNT